MPAKNPKTHKVQKGETSKKIAAKYGLETSDIIKANGLKPPYKLKVGTVLQLASDSSKKGEKKKSVKTQSKKVTKPAVRKKVSDSKKTKTQNSETQNSVTKKTSPKKSSTKKAVTKKTTPKKPVTKKATPKKTVAKKVTSKNVASKKGSTQKKTSSSGIKSVSASIAPATRKEKKTPVTAIYATLIMAAIFMVFLVVLIRMVILNKHGEWNEDYKDPNFRSEETWFNSKEDTKQDVKISEGEVTLTPNKNGTEIQEEVSDKIIGEDENTLENSDTQNEEVSENTDNEEEEPVVPLEIQTVILNGSGVKGRAATLRNVLATKNVETVSVGNADRFDYESTIIKYPIEKLEEALVLKRYFDELNWEGSIKEGFDVSEITIIIGTDNT